MNPDYETPVSIVNMNSNGGFEASNGRIVLYNNTEITLFEKDGSFWVSERISLDGLRNISIKNNIITGQFSDYSRNWEWFDFSLNIDTNEITGLTHYSVLTQNPWWKIW